MAADVLPKINGAAIGSDTVQAPPLAPPFPGGRINILAAALAELRADFLAVLDAELAPLREEVALLRDTLDALMALVRDQRAAPPYEPAEEKSDAQPGN